MRDMSAPARELRTSSHCVVCGKRHRGPEPMMLVLIEDVDDDAEGGPPPLLQAPLYYNCMAEDIANRTAEKVCDAIEDGDVDPRPSEFSSIVAQTAAELIDRMRRGRKG